MTATAGVATGETAQGGLPTPKRKGLNAGQSRRGMFLVAPTILMLAAVIIYPIVDAVYISFQQDQGKINPATGAFEQGGAAGFTNYTHWLLQQCAKAGGGTTTCPNGSLGAQFYQALFVTLFFTVVCVFLETLLGMWFAMIMNREFKGRALLRAAVLIPWAIPTAVTAKLWYFIFAYDGIANHLLHAHILWTGGQWSSRLAIIIADTWKTAPFMALLILAGLQVIPSDVYEAASIDGASKWQQYRMITLPLVRTALMVAVLFRTLDTLRIYDLPAILTGGAGGNGNATTTLSILVIKQVRAGFHSAAALSTITFLLIFFVAFIFVKFLGASVVQSNPAKKKAKAN